MQGRKRQITHVEKLYGKVTTTDGLIREGCTGLIDKKHGVCDAAEGFVRRVGDILVGMVEGEKSRKVGRCGKDLGAGRVFAQ